MTTTEGWYDASDASTITEAAGKVSQWDDKSGNARHLVQAAGAEQPTTGIRQQNGLNILDGDGTEWMGFTPFPINADGNISIFAVFIVDTVSSWRNGIFAMDAASGPDFKFVSGPNGDVSGTFLGWVQGSYGDNLTLVGGPFPGPSIYNTEFDKTGSGLATARVDGTDRASGAYTSALATPMFLTVLTDKNALYDIDGAVAEVIVTRDLRTSERQLIEGYLAWKWGLEANLPADHPFKNIVPGTVLGNGGSGLSGAILAAMSTRGY